MDQTALVFLKKKADHKPDSVLSYHLSRLLIT